MNPNDTESLRTGTSWWKVVLAFLLAAALLWLVFKDCDLNAILGYLKTIDPVYVISTLIVGLISHILRAWRWIILLKPVANRSVSLWNSFYAIVSGYVVNLGIPRGGEVVRLVVMARAEKLPWPGVAPTVFIDRLLDLALLVLIFAAAVPFIPSKVHEQMSWLTSSSIALMVVTVTALALLPVAAPIMTRAKSLPMIKGHIPEGISHKLDDLIEQFHQGTRCITDPIAYPMILLLTGAMWFCYYLTFYLMILGFHLEKQVDAMNCFLCFAIGTLGNLVPTPGSVGGFHGMVTSALTMITGIDKNAAAAFATVLHFLCFIVSAVIPAAFCWVVESTRNKAAATATASGEQDPAQGKT